MLCERDYSNPLIKRKSKTTGLIPYCRGIPQRICTVCYIFYYTLYENKLPLTHTVHFHAMRPQGAQAQGSI